jgi:hypothetical protein
MTKIKINFEDQNITTKTPKSFQVKQLLDTFYTTLKIDRILYRLEIFTTGNFFNQNEILVPKENQQFYLLKIDIGKQVEKPKLDITLDKLIKDATGANSLPKPGVIKRERNFEGSFINFLRAHGIVIIRSDEDISEPEDSDDESEDQNAYETRQVSRENINRMVEMGMEQQRAMYCLYFTRNNVSEAIDFYFSTADEVYGDMEYVLGRVVVSDVNESQIPSISLNSNSVNNEIMQSSAESLIQANNIVNNNNQANNMVNSNNNIANPFMPRQAQLQQQQQPQVSSYSIRIRQEFNPNLQDRIHFLFNRILNRGLDNEDDDEEDGNF